MYFVMNWFFLSMLGTLLVMNFYWSYYLIKAVVGFLKVKELKADYNVREQKRE